MGIATAWLRTSAERERFLLTAGGSWTIHQAAAVDSALRAVAFDGVRRAVFDLSQVTGFDSAGAWLLYRTLQELQGRGIATETSGLADSYQPLLKLVEFSAGRGCRAAALHTRILAGDG